MIITNGTNLRIGGRLMGAGAFNPASLFVGSDGLLLDMSRLDSLSQDSAGTTAVTAPGQPVGLVRDMSGRGRNASQSVSDARPTYRVDGGGRKYLEYDAVNDFLNTAAFAWGSDEVTIIAALRKRSDAAEGQVVNFGDLGTNGAFLIGAPGGVPSDRIYTGSRGSSNAFAVSYSAAHAAPLYAVVTMQAKISSDLNILRVNGSQAASAAGDQGVAATYGNRQLFIGRRNGNAFAAAIDLYGLIAINRVLSSTELGKAEKWAATKCGVSF